jgi:hypothetical protein
MIIDKTLQELEYARGRKIEELEGTPIRKLEEIDPRESLVFWARPTDAVRDLVQEVQARLAELDPGIPLYLFSSNFC